VARFCHVRRIGAQPEFAARNYLWFSQGANNAALAAAGYNFRRLIRWLRLLLSLILAALFPGRPINPA
jgi:IS5 family transposase